MFKKISILFLIVMSEFLIAQVLYPSDKIKLLSVIDPNKDSVSTVGLTNKYAGCWGWYQVDKKKEYALIGGTNGTYFVDITDPTSPKICDFVYASNKTIWREIKNYKNYCYSVTEYNGGLQIIDMKYLPDSVHVVSFSNNCLKKSHTIWIDGNKMYCGLLGLTGTVTAGIGVYSLLNPEQPVFLRSINSDFPFVSAHDMYARHDTVYASDANNGLEVLKYDSVANKFNIIGSYSGYTKQGYNHSNFLTENGKYLVFCDEIPEAVPIHLVDVSNVENIQPVSEFLPYPLTTPHNPYILGNDWAIISCYADGLHIYNISDPINVKHVGFFDTCPQSGFLQGQYSGNGGNWGAYPFLPSKTIIATDITNGAFFLDASEIYKTKPDIPTTISEEKISDCAIIYTNPTSKYLQIKGKGQSGGKITLSSPEGKVFLSKTYTEEFNEKINTENLANGFYIISVSGNECKVTKKILITHFD